MPRSFERVDQGLLWQFLDDRFNDPSQPRGHVARQRDGTTLNEPTPFPLLKSPVGIQPPQKSGTCIRRHHFLLPSSSVLHFSDSRPLRATNPPCSIHRALTHPMIG